MALPGNFATRPVQGTYVSLAGKPMSGEIEFAIEPILVDGAASVIIIPVPLPAELDENGHFSIDVPVTDDPDVSPSPFRYRVTEKLVGGVGRNFYLDVPGGVSTPIDLSGVDTSGGPVEGTTTYVTLAAFTAEQVARTEGDQDQHDYTDTQVASAGTAANNYTDAQVSAVGTAANSYTDTKFTAAGTAANSYTDTKFTAAGTAANTYTDTKFTAAGTAANTYTDTKFAAAIPATAKGAVNGVASLGSDGKIPSGQLPVSIGTIGTYVPPSWGQFWKAKRNAAATGLATIAAVGSSSTQGLYSSNLLTTSFVSQIMTSLQGTYGDGGSGYFSSARSTTFFGAGANYTAWAALAGNFASTSGTWAIGNPYGPGANYLSTSVNGAFITFTVRGTTVRIYTMSGGGRVNWTYSIDGAAAVSVVDSGVVSIQVTTITGLSAGSHTVKLTHNGAGGSFFSPCGVTGENATGVVVNNYGLSGAQTATFSDLSASYMPGTWNGGPSYPADLLIYALGANDAQASVTADTYATNLRKFLSSVKDGTSASGAKATGNTDILILMQHIGTYDSASLKWHDYVGRAREIAEAYDAALVDMWTIGRNSWNYWNNLGNWGNSATAGGVSGTDTIHMSDAGHSATANALLPILTS